jgi:predicted Zn-dependent peptidase
LLWLPAGKFGLSAAIDKVRGALRPGLVSPDDFEKARTNRVTSALLRLDAIPTRLTALAHDTQLDAPARALEALDPHGFDALIATRFDWSRARVIELEPDGTRSPMHPASLSDPPHMLRGPSGFPDVDEAPPTALASHVLGAARTFTLPNGLRVMLVPSSPVPVVEVRLVVLGGIADEPADHPGTAIVAAAAFDQLARRGPHAAAGEWAAGQRATGAGFDTSGLALRGPTMYVDLLFQQLEGVSQPLGIADLQKGREKLVDIAESPVHALWDRGLAIRAKVYGPAHPYARARPPTQKDIAAFDARAVEDFYAHYFAPDNALLIVSGGFDPDVVAQLATRTFSSWTGHGTRTPIATQAPRPGAFAVAETSPTVNVHISWPAPVADAHDEARHLLAKMMNATQAQVFGQYVVLPQGAHYQLDVRLPPATAPRQLTWIVDQLDHLGTGDSRYKAAFVAARRRGVRAYLQSMSLGQWTSALQFASLEGRDLAWLRDGAVRLSHVTYDEVAKLASSELALDRATFYVTGPRESVEAIYGTLGLTPRWLDP